MPKSKHRRNNRSRPAGKGLNHAARAAAAASAAACASRPTRSPASPWPEPRAAELALLESLDGYAPLRNGLRRVAAGIAEWAGIPMPIEGQHLVVEPGYAKAADIMAALREAEAAPAAGGAPEPAEENDLEGAVIRNRFPCWYGRAEVVIWEKDGRIDWGRVPRVHHVEQQLQTLGCADAWGIEQEQRALKLLGSLLRHRQFKQYLLTGMFLETSPRSRVHYLFRRLRPTLALRDQGDGKGSRILCALCLHPIAYYAGSWAGGMCPTDDVVAHLMMMRGDEVMFWRRANQHSATAPEAGI